MNAQLEVNNAVVVCEFGKVKFVPIKPGGEFRADAIVYVRGQNGSGDVFISPFAGYQVRPGIEHPMLTPQKLDSGLKPGNDVFFVRKDSDRTASLWGLASSYDKAVLKIAERPEYRLTRKNFLGGKPTSVPTEELGVGTIPQLTRKLGDLPNLQRSAIDITFEYHWETRRGPDDVWRTCRSPVKIADDKIAVNGPPEYATSAPRAATASCNTHEPPAEKDDPCGQKLLDGLCRNRGENITLRNRRGWR